MDATRCNVIYVDRSIHQDRVHRPKFRPLSENGQLTQSGDKAPVPWESLVLENNVTKLASVFGDVHLCASGNACITKLFNLLDESMLDLKPTVVLIDTPHDERIPLDVDGDTPSRSPSPHSTPQPGPEEPQSPPADDVYGLRLLQRIVSEAHIRNLSKLIVPVPIIDFPDSRATTSHGPKSPMSEIDSQQRPDRPTSRPLLKRCLKLGATDVLLSPIRSQCLTSLEINAYWAHKSAARDQQALLEFQRGRRRSWVGISDTRPYPYLRESMVANLMKRICQMESGTELPIEAVRLAVPARRRPVIAAVIGSWHFSAHELSADELVEASALIFKHALSLPELSEWRIPNDQLICFLIACRAAYNTFVPYHNFRHVVDVLQATFNFLVNIGALPPYPATLSTNKRATPLAKSPMASLIKPFEALTLLITAIGHDVGHPGVNNGFLIELSTPLAQLYNDRSVLESFHCAAYSQILRRYWPTAFAHTKMRKLMISSILATDMGCHFDYMKKLSSVRTTLAEKNSTEDWDARMLDDQAALACALLIKCADISNVARRLDAAVQWMYILSDEFSRQHSMETQLDIKSSLMAKPTKDIVALYRSQLSFMDLFAIPLFREVAGIMPSLQYCVDELEANRILFEKGIADENAKQEAQPPPGVDTSAAPPTEKDLPQSQARPASPTRARDSFGTPKNAANGGEEYPCPPRLSTLDNAYRGHGGEDAPFSTAEEFAASDPFSVDDGRVYAPTKQRASEATDGSTSLPSGGDWASQATSATTGKMPLSPSTKSTQGTSVVSRDSMELPSGMPVVSVSTADADGRRLAKTLSGSVHATPIQNGEDETSLSSSGNSNGNSGGGKSPSEGRGLRKKTSRFRMNALTFFRRRLSPGPSLPRSQPSNDATQM